MNPSSASTAPTVQKSWRCLPTEALLAPPSRPPGQILVSKGLVDTLSLAVAAVVRHEAPHLMHDARAGV